MGWRDSRGGPLPVRPSHRWSFGGCSGPSSLARRLLDDTAGSSGENADGLPRPRGAGARAETADPFTDDRGDAICRPIWRPWIHPFRLPIRAALPPAWQTATFETDRLSFRTLPGWL